MFIEGSLPRASRRLIVLSYLDHVVCVAPWTILSRDRGEEHLWDESTMLQPEPEHDTSSRGSSSRRSGGGAGGRRRAAGGAGARATKLGATHGNKLAQSTIDTRVSRTKAVAVIGAGVSGLVCASELRQAGLMVRVIEMGRGPGGRLATRREAVRG